MNRQKHQTAGLNKYGEPPYGHAELSTLKSFTKKIGLDLTASLKRLRKANIRFDDENQSLKDIARVNDISPQNLFEAMKPIAAPRPSDGLPPTPPSGTGNKTLSEFALGFNFDIQLVLKLLTDKNITATADMTLKQIARRNDMAPTDVFILLREIVQG